MKRTLFTNAMIFDGSGTDPFLGEVLVEGESITAVVPGLDQIDRSGLQLINCSGQTLMPGMVESHAHLTWPSNIERIVNGMSLPIEEHMLVTAQNARITLDHGFTSAYSAGSLGQNIEPVLRDMIDQGFIPGPRLKASALEKGMENVMGVPKGHDQHHDRNIDGLKQYVHDMKALGCDSIKMLLTSDEGFAPGGSEVLLYSAEEIQAIGQAAREADIWLACHSQSAESIKQAVTAGFRILFHCIHADEEALDMMEAKKDEIFMAPAPGLLYARCFEAEEFGIGKKEAEDLGAFLGLEMNQKNVPEMRKRGIRVVPGCDYGFPYNPVGRNARDLEIFVDMFGFTTKEALVAATKHGGELLDLPVGEIKQGYLADILLVQGDPTQDVRILQNKDNITVVMKGGSFYRQPLQSTLI